MTATKFWVAAIGGAASSAIVIFGGNTLAGKICAVILAAVTAAGVWQLPNAPAEAPKDPAAN